MSTRRAAGMAAVVAILAAACASSPPNTNPRRGRVAINVEGKHVGDKWCLGTTLVIDLFDGSGSPLPDSPECTPPATENR
jgi:hypothetical protein